MIKGIMYILVALGIFFAGVKYIETKGIFFPVKEIMLTPEVINLTFEDVYIKTQDNVQINSWFIPHEGARYTMLFFHGNAGNNGDRLDKILLLYGLKVNIFIIDYRGYGKSEGAPSEKGIYLDAKAAYDYLVNDRKIKPEQIILYGESLGAAVCIDLASKVEVKTLILEGAFSRGRDMARIIYPFLPPFLFSNTFDSFSKIKEINAPKLFIHSINDEIVPFESAQKLYQAAKPPKQFIDLTGGHNTAFLDSKDKYTSSIKTFIENL